MRLQALNTFLLASAASATLNYTSYPGSVALSASFDPIIAAYWTGLPHHRRTPFSVSPSGEFAHLAFLSAPSYASVIVQPVNPETLAASSSPTAFIISGAREASGIVSHDSGSFAILVTIDEIATIVKVSATGKELWRTALNGPTVDNPTGHTVTPDLNGDFTYSAASDVYGAYFVVTATDGEAQGHFGDNLQYVNATTGELLSLTGATSSSFGCSHNTGIALAPAAAPPFASVCAEDHGAIWLNTDTQGMSGPKIANENVTNGCSGEPMGGMGGSYSNLAALADGAYMFAWASRGAREQVADEWMGTGFTATAEPRWLHHNVAIAPLASKDKLRGAEAVSTVGATAGDSQVTWITYNDRVDHQNVHVAALPDGEHALVTWEVLLNPDCQPLPLGCTGTFGGTYAQVVSSAGKRVGKTVNLGTKVTVGGDLAVVGERVCWPYVEMDWDLSVPRANGTLVQEVGFGCVEFTE
ncbi:hypothetical protein EDC01DRAFT_333498 [Geopyxis carbonaria]|nr:hypothetical protein EDC01DRAFT_333498 [Geopyxis carbonaria]